MRPYLIQIPVKRQPLPPKEIRRVALVTTLDSSDINNWSGIFVYLHDALAQVFPEVVRIGPLKSTRDPMGVLRRLISWTRKPKQDHPLWLTQISAKGMARQVEEKIAELKPDAIFCVWHPPAAYLRTSLPVFMFQDSPFEIIQPLYDGMAHFTPAIMKEVQLVERVAAKRCTGIIETSDWAADEARKLWRLPDEKVASIPFGANVQTSVNSENLSEVVKARGYDECRLLWLGKEWGRKGGDIALEAAKLLNKRGLKTKLLVVGCAPPVKDECLVEVGFIDKKTPEGKAKLDEILRTSHFLVLPTKAEAFGIVYCEAAAFAMPSMAPDVMGVGSAVIDGKTGVLLRKDAPAVEYADEIERLMKSPAEYEALSESAYKYFQEHFTWESVGKQIRAFMLERASKM